MWSWHFPNKKSSSKLPTIYGMDFPLWLFITTAHRFLTVLHKGSIPSTGSKPKTSPQVMLRIGHLPSIILNLGRWYTRPFLSSTNSFWASFLLPPDILEANTLFASMWFFRLCLPMRPDLPGKAPRRDIYFEGSTALGCSPWGLLSLQSCVPYIFLHYRSQLEYGHGNTCWKWLAEIKFTQISF